MYFSSHSCRSTNEHNTVNRLFYQEKIASKFIVVAVASVYPINLKYSQEIFWMTWQSTAVLHLCLSSMTLQGCNSLAFSCTWQTSICSQFQRWTFKNGLVPDGSWEIVSRAREPCKQHVVKDGQGDKDRPSLARIGTGNGDYFRNCKNAKDELKQVRRRKRLPGTSQKTYSVDKCTAEQIRPTETAILMV